MVKPVLPFVEIMVTQACNLSCHGCTNYSDLVHSGYLTWKEGHQQIIPWLEKVDIPDFGILGGEPLMNPDIRNWIIGLRELMPNSQIRFTTNGLLLENNFDIVDLLHKIGNVVFKIAVHQKNVQLENVIEKINKKYDWEPVVEFGVSRLKTSNNFRFHVKRPEIFYKTYQGTYQTMMPHDSNPKDAFEICCQQTCPLLYKGKLYKCSTSGLLEDTLTRVGFPNKELWDQFIYKGISPTDSESEINQFLENFGKPHQMCKMCPTKKDLSSTIIHLDNVSTQKVKI